MIGWMGYECEDELQEWARVAMWWMPEDWQAMDRHSHRKRAMAATQPLRGSAARMSQLIKGRPFGD